MKDIEVTQKTHRRKYQLTVPLYDICSAKEIPKPSGGSEECRLFRFLSVSSGDEEDGPVSHLWAKGSNL